MEDRIGNIDELRREIDTLDEEIKDMVEKRSHLAREAFHLVGYDHARTNTVVDNYKKELGSNGAQLALLLIRMSTPSPNGNGDAR